MENNINIEEVLIVDEEVKVILDKHESQLCDHAGRIAVQENKISHIDDEIDMIQIKNATYDERFNSIDFQFDSIKNTLVRMENASLSTSSILINSLSQIATNANATSNEIKKDANNNKAEIIKSKIDNSTKIVLKVLGIIALVVSGIFAAKYGVQIPAIFN